MGRENRSWGVWGGNIFIFWLKCWTQLSHCWVQRTSQAVCSPALGWDREVAAAEFRSGAGWVPVLLLQHLASSPSSPFFPALLLRVLHSSYTSPCPPNLSKGHIIPPVAHFSSDLCCAKYPTRVGSIWNSLVVLFANKRFWWSHIKVIYWVSKEHKLHVASGRGTLQKGAQMPMRNEAEAQLCPWGLLCSQVFAGRRCWGGALRMVLFFFGGYWKVGVNSLKISLKKNIPGSSVSTQVKAQPSHYHCLDLQALNTPTGPLCLKSAFQGPQFLCCVCLSEISTLPTGCDMKRPGINKEKQAGEPVLLFPPLSTVMRWKKDLF